MLSTLCIFIHLVHTMTRWGKYCCFSIFIDKKLIHRDVKQHSQGLSCQVIKPGFKSRQSGSSICALDNYNIRSPPLFCKEFSDHLVTVATRVNHLLEDIGYICGLELIWDWKDCKSITDASLLPTTYQRFLPDLYLTSTPIMIFLIGNTFSLPETPFQNDSKCS